MTRWEYIAIKTKKNRQTERGVVEGQDVEHLFDVETVLNALGAEGWELVAAEPDDQVFYLKRPRE